MITIRFIVVVSSAILAALAPAKVTDLQTNSSPEHGLIRPAIIHVKSFSISKSAATSADSAGGGRPHLLGALRGGEENTFIGQHREQEQQDTLAKLPGLLQQALIGDLSKSVAPADSGDNV